MTTAPKSTSKLNLDFSKVDDSSQFQEMESFLSYAFPGNRAGKKVKVAVSKPGDKSTFRAWLVDLDSNVFSDLLKRSKTHNVFIGSALFKPDSTSTRAEDVLSSRTVWVDIDPPHLDEKDDRGNKVVDLAQMAEHKAKVGRFKAEWNKLGARVTLSGSVGGYHVRFRVNRDLTPGETRALNWLAAERYDGDRKFSPEAVLRLPGTLNHKTAHAREVRALKRNLGSIWDPFELAHALGWEDSFEALAQEMSTQTYDGAEDYEGEEVNLKKYAAVAANLDAVNRKFESGDYPHRYKATWGIVKDCMAARMSVEQAIYVANQSEPLMDKSGEERGFSIARDVYRVWNKEASKRGGKPKLASVEGGKTVEEVPVDRFESIDWAKEWQKDFSKPDWLPGMILERGQQMTLAADGKAGKSLVVLDWCRSMALGLPFLGHTTGEKYTILYFDKENSLGEIISRLQALGVEKKDLPELQARFIYKRFPGFSGTLDDPKTDAADELLEIVDEVNPDIVVLDTASRFIGGNENESHTWLQLYQLIHAPLKARDIASVRIDHFGKDSDKGARGSSAKSQDVDHVWELVKKSERKDSTAEGEWVITTISLKRTHTRTGHGDDNFGVIRRGMKSGEKTWASGKTSHTLEKSQDRIDAASHEMSVEDAVLDQLQRNIGHGFTKMDMADRIGGGLTKEYMGQVLDRLAKGGSKKYNYQGQISITSGAHRAKIWTYYSE